ncbi:hypothetical protein ACF3NA_07515 [Alkanindiges sp. WGS2144]|uniref:hypothetical protein n=1 Tax=Alkanindiges sp. WGS2144 TaxID=3366808 RepID=UPI003751905E
MPFAAPFQLYVAGLLLLTTNISLAAPQSATPPTTVSTSTTLVSQQPIQQQVKSNTARLQQLEQANQDALARNQELQLMNDNLTVQVQVLQSERSAQMFLYGAATLAAGAFIGFLFANYLLGKRSRRW